MHPWFNAKLRHLCQAKEDICYKRAKYTRKGDPSCKEESFWKAKDPVLFQWHGFSVERSERQHQLQNTSPSTEANQQLANNLNEFYCRFKKTPLTPPALQINEDYVWQVLRKNKRRKAPGPDGVTPACLNTCADQLAPIFTQIFNKWLERCEVPSCFKRSTIIPIPKKPQITGLNDYRPVALTSVAMKSCEILVLPYLKDITGPPAVCLPDKQV